MIGTILMLIGCIVLAGWGIAHIVPTKMVADGFGDVGKDNRTTIIMTWASEGFFMFFLGALVGLVTIFGETASTAGRITIWTSVGFLAFLTFWHAITGARTKVVPMRLCPFIIGTSTILIFIGSLVH
jgi:hypothetical protein